MGEPRVCAYAACRRVLPRGSSASRRHCSDRCRQACHRERIRAADAPPVAGSEELTRAVRRGAAALARASTAVASAPDADGRLVRDAVALRDLLDRVLVAAVTHDRAHGDSWTVVAAGLGVHPEAARRRYRNRAAGP